MSRDALLSAVAAGSLTAGVPAIRPGMTVRVAQKIKEGDKERVQNFEGLVIAVNGGTGVAGTYTVRRIASGVGVEKTFALHSKNVASVTPLKQAKIRRSKLYYMRDLQGKAARLKEVQLTAPTPAATAAAEPVVAATEPVAAAAEAVAAE